MKKILKDFRAFPSQVKYIIGNEACERFGYYGMKCVLVIFMVDKMKMTAEKAETVFHSSVALAYLTPLLGGYLSDRFLGRYKTILYLSLVYCLGYFCLALGRTELELYFGLGLIGLGAGGIKPCVSAYVGDQIPTNKPVLLARVFDLFYWSINFGSFFSTLAIPIVLTRYGSQVAFGIPGFLMVIATFIFWLGRKKYVNVPAARTAQQPSFVGIVLYSLFHFKKKKRKKHFLDVAKDKYSDQQVDGAKIVFAIIQVFITVSIFWALWEQTGSSWVLQASRMNLDAWGFHIEPSQLQAINPIAVMALIPFFSSVVYPGLKKIGIQVTALRKMTAGMILAGFSFISLGIIEGILNSGESISVLWQLVPALILACSEVMIYVSGLEFAYAQAPKFMKSTIMSFWLVTIFLGNLLDVVIMKMNIFQGVWFFYFFAVLMFLVSVVFGLGAYRARHQFKKE